MESRIHEVLAKALSQAKEEHKIAKEWSEAHQTETEGSFEEGWLKATEKLVKEIAHIVDEHSSGDEKHYHVSFVFTTDVWANDTDEAIEKATAEYEVRGGSWEVTDIS